MQTPRFVALWLTQQASRHTQNNMGAPSCMNLPPAVYVVLHSQWTPPQGILLPRATCYAVDACLIACTPYMPSP